MAYSHTTFATMKAQLALRLSDSAKVFWIDDELSRYIKTALRTWNAMTMFWRDRGTFDTTTGVMWYDIPSLLKDGGGNLLRGYGLTDFDAISELQYMLLEPSTGNTWTGSEQFTLADCTQALERRRNQFLMESGAVVNVVPVAGLVAPVSRVTLDDSVIAVRRCAYVDTNSAYRTLRREDEWAFNAFAQGWSYTAATPEAYSVAVTPHVSIQLSPIAQNGGTLELLAVQAPTALDPTGPTLLNIPDDFVWTVIFGAMADLLGKNSLAYDPDRAAYCERRYREGVELARLWGSVNSGAIQVGLNAVPAQVTSVADLDDYNQSWQNATSAPPTMLALASMNLLAVSPKPDAGPYSITLDVVRNAPIPTGNGDYIQLGREELDAVLSYAQHLATFKQGGQEFVNTYQHYRRMLELATTYNEQLRANSLFQEILDDRARMEDVSRPLREPRDGLLAAQREDLTTGQ